ncbi:MAG: adenosylcobinamide-phosphate synthase CbiB [Ruminococcus sp.]|uniref:adenosylcobinamide-phosphate synthase CbiB n=1 Tax=Ruminococcus sp. TaxID=41978 RepID=UPI0025CE2598|nr:adenosylcobinamide-phosphate synthase CbiB [Ruminococcus sp.]MCR4796579.1 adenosylcobinamide-phosphate synthase CbiB [Ruminococcus sp.]
MNYIIGALPLVIAAVLDCLLGDPYSLPHPIRLIGKLISKLEAIVRRKWSSDLRKGGVFLALTVILISVSVPLLILIILYSISTWLGAAAEGVMCYYLVAAKCLRDESMKVYHAAEKNDVEGARKAVSMIVGRDTAVLDKDGIIKAAVETVAENTSDGVTAPIMYMSFGGAVLGAFYKSVNTMDSMIGYKNGKYADIGRFAAKLDDVLNYFPSRLTALAMVVTAPFIGLNCRDAYRIWIRDGRKHASPNSAQTESACAGALGVQLAGDAYYFGELHKKEFIGDPKRSVENEDIRRANRLMYASSALVFAAALAVRCIIVGGILC